MSKTMKKVMVLVMVMSVQINQAEAGFLKYYGYGSYSNYGLAPFNQGFLSSYGYGGSGYYGNNVRVRSDEQWDLQAGRGRRTFEQRPDLTGKIIDAATTLGALTIIYR